MDFIYLGLVDEDLKDDALELKALWNDIISNKQKRTKSIVLDTINSTYIFQNGIKKMMMNGIWLGWLSFSFIEHLIKESIYFERKIINETYNINDEIKFWLWHHKSEIEGSEKLLDPSEIQISDISKQFIDKIKFLEEDMNKLDDFEIAQLSDETQEILNEYLDQTESLKMGIEDKKILTNISLDLIKHVIREGKRAIEIFDKLQL